MLTDLIILLVLILFALNGYRRGFLVLAGRLLILGVSIVLSLLLLSPTSGLLNHLPFMRPFVETLNEKIIHPLLPAASSLTDSLLRLSLPVPVQKLILAGFPDPHSPVSDVWPALSSQLAHYTLTLVTFMLLLAVISLVLRTTIAVMSDVLDRVPVAGGLNHVTGLLIGLIHGTLVIFLVVLALGVAAPFFPWLSAALQNSQIILFVYEQNIIERGFAFILKSI